MCSPVSFLNPHGLYPTRLLCPWDLPGKNIEVHCHFLLHSSTVITTFPDYFLFAGSLPEKHLSGGSDSKASACNAGGPGSSPRSGRSPGEGNGNPLQYSCLENAMDRGGLWATVHGVAKSRTRLSDFTSSLGLCHSFKGCAPSPSLLFQLHLLKENMTIISQDFTPTCVYAPSG